MFDTIAFFVNNPVLKYRPKIQHENPTDKLGMETLQPNPI